MDYRSKRAEASRDLFADFRPDFSKLRGDVQTAHRILDMARNGYFSHEIAEATGKTPKAIQKFFRRYDFPTLHNFAPPLREDRQGWNGGVKIVKGYAYSRTPGHPHASTYGEYVAVHRLEMGKKLGRYLLPSEVVHHIDGDPSNNDPSNLEVFENNGKHLAATLAGRVPNWSEDGKRRIAASTAKHNRLRKSKKAGATPPA